MESAATGTLNDAARQDHAIQPEQAIQQDFSPGLASQPALRPQSEDGSSRGTPPPLSASTSSTRDWAREIRQAAGTPPPPPDTMSYPSPPMTRNGPPDQGRQLNRTPSPDRSLSGSHTGQELEYQEEIAYPYVEISPIPPNAVGIATPPPEDDSPKHSDDLERGEKRVVESASHVNAAKSAKRKKSALKKILRLPTKDRVRAEKSRNPVPTNDADIEFEKILRLPTKDRVGAVNSRNLVYNRRSDGALAINFATMQRMRLQSLQSELVKQALDIRYHGLSNSDWEESLKKYIQAWRDLDYMHDCAKRKNDPFMVTSSKCLGAAAIREHLADIGSGLTDEQQELVELYRDHSAYPGPIDLDKPEVLGGYRTTTIKETKLQDFLVRLGMASLGWLFIVGPMLLMVLNNTKFTALLTTSVCVGTFGLMMARALEKPSDVLSATAAYAAVLVVFVGTTTSPGAGD
ncbi:MAG: hypothetical protein Q9191_008254 [Dirinaria sp. TL-2023a]